MNFRTAISILFGAIVGLALVAEARASAVDSARADFDAGRYAEAVKLLRAEEDRHSSDPEVYYWLARSEFELRDFEAAIKAGDHAIELSPNNSEYHYLLGRAYGRKAEHSSWFSGVGLAKKTHAEFERAIELDPRNIPARRDLANYEARAPGFVGGGDERALEQIRMIEAIDPVQGHLARKDFFVDKREWGFAEEECKAVMSANPRTGGPYVELAEYYARREEGVSVSETLAAAKHNGVSDPRLDFFAGVAAGLTKEHVSEGESALNRFLNNFPPRVGEPSHSDAHLWLGRLSESKGDRDQAISEFREAIKADPSNHAAHEALKRAGG